MGDLSGALSAVSSPGTTSTGMLGFHMLFIPVALFDEPSKQPQPSEPTLEDHRFALIKGGLSSLPFVGGALPRKWGLLLIAPLSRRRDE